MLIDTHAHIQFSAYDEDRNAVFDQCKDEDVGMILVGCDYRSSVNAVEMARQRKDSSVWASVGQHPTDTGIPFDRKQFCDLIKTSSRVVAIGECGLDYYRIPKQKREEAPTENSSVDSRQAIQIAQKELMSEHLKLAHEFHLPLIIHCRDAHNDMIQMLIEHFTHGGKEPLEQSREHGVMHCFTGTLAYAQSYLDLGFLISFTGIITFTKEYDEVVRGVPLGKILIETDSPFLTPVPYRGKKNNPVYVKYVARRIAEIKNISFEEVARQTTLNAQRLFSLEASY